jgi:hypothetical protein
VMHRLYHAPIRSKIEYGSFVYGSVEKSRLSVIDPVHNTELRLATWRLSHQPSGESVRNPASPHYPSVGIFSATTSRGWQRNPRIPRTELQVRLFDIGSSTCGCSASRSVTGTWRTVTPFYPP